MAAERGVEMPVCWPEPYMVIRIMGVWRVGGLLEAVWQRELRALIWKER